MTISKYSVSFTDYIKYDRLMFSVGIIDDFSSLNRWNRHSVDLDSYLRV